MSRRPGRNPARSAHIPGMKTAEATTPLNTALNDVLEDFTGRFERAVFRTIAQETDPLHDEPYDVEAEEKATALQATLAEIKALHEAGLPPRTLRRELVRTGQALEARANREASEVTANVLRSAGAALITASANRTR